MFGNAHLFQQIERSLVALVGRIVEVGEIHGQHHILGAGQHGQQLEGLKDHAHVTPTPGRNLVFAEAINIGPCHADLAGGGPVEAGHQVDQG
jgi:hypothetical protein